MVETEETWLSGILYEGCKISLEPEIEDNVLEPQNFACMGLLSFFQQMSYNLTFIKFTVFEQMKC